MELLTHRYRTLTVLVLTIVGQVLLLGYQVRTQHDIRLVRLWAVTVVTPVARLLESVRARVSGMLDSYVFLVGVREENDRLNQELGVLKQEAQYLRRELASAERAEALAVFRKRNPSRTVAARIIGAGMGPAARVVFVDRGTTDGVAKGMAVITPDGVVGRVSAVYPTASQVVLISDPGFALGVVSQRNHVVGTLKGQSGGLCVVDYIQNDEDVVEGEWFFTSGDERVFPKGLPVGQATVVREGQLLKKILLAPSGLKQGLEEVLVVIEGVHQPIPPVAEESPSVGLLPPPDPAAGDLAPPPGSASPAGLSTDADRVLEHYQEVGNAQGHTFGEGAPGSPPPDFNLDPNQTKATPPPATEEEKAPATP